MNLLTREDADGKYRVASRLVLEAHGLWHQIPPQQRPSCERAVRETIWNEFSLNRDWAQRGANNQVRTRDPEARSRIMGFQLVAATERVRLAIGSEHGLLGRQAVTWQVAAREHELGLAEKAVRLAARRSEPDVSAAAEAWTERLAREAEPGGAQPAHPTKYPRPQAEPENPAPVRAAATLASTGQPRPRRTVSPSQRRASRGDRTIER